MPLCLCGSCQRADISLSAYGDRTQEVMRLIEIGCLSSIVYPPVIVLRFSAFGALHFLASFAFLYAHSPAALPVGEAANRAAGRAAGETACQAACKAAGQAPECQLNLLNQHAQVCSYTTIA